jgi:hypothetical protein
MNNYKLSFLHTEKGHTPGLVLASIFTESYERTMETPYDILLTYCQSCGLLLKPYAHFNPYIMAL